MRLKWETSNQNLKFLKTESVLKLDFNLDSFSIDGTSGALAFKKKHAGITNLSINTDSTSVEYSIWKDSLKTKFEGNFSENSGKSLQAKYDVKNQAYNYTIKVTPLKFNLLRVEHMPSSNSYRVNIWYSFYMQGEYLIEIYGKGSNIPLTTLRLSNLTNKYPMRSDGSKVKYSNDEIEELNRNMIRAGIESAKYIRKLIKKSY